MYEVSLWSRYDSPLKRITVALFYFCACQLYGQVPTSLSISPYSGINRIFHNPANGVSSSSPWDINLVSGHLFADNDYSFVRKASLFNLNGQLANAEVIDAQGAIPESSQLPLILFDLDKGSKHAFIRGNINGPGFTVKMGQDLRVGIFSNIRAHMSSNDIPENFGFYELNESYQTNIIEVNPGQLSWAGWLEIGAHFSKQIGPAAFGFNIKYLNAYEGGYFTSQSDATYAFVDSVVMTNGNVDFDIAFTNSSINQGSLETNSNGTGIGIDIGFTYKSEFLDFGASISDIGVIQFKSNVEIYDSEILQNIEMVRTQDYRNFTSIRNLIDQLQNDLNLTPDNFGVFSVGLPTRISLFADYYYKNNISISGQLNQRLPFFPNSLKSNNTIIITPRYETRIFSAFLPVTIYEFQSLRIGTAFRIGPFTIGSDHISSVLFPSDFFGSDIFFSLNIYPFSQNNSSSGRDVMCPLF